MAVPLPGPTRRATCLAALALLLAVLPHVTFAAFDLPKTAISGGAVEAAQGSYKLRGTVGEAGIVGRTSGGSYDLWEGFWPSVYFLCVTDAPYIGSSEVRFVNRLFQSYPNPFRKDATIRFSVSQPSPVRLRIYDVSGRRVATLLDEMHAPGAYVTRWAGRGNSGRPVASGVYFYRLDIGSWSETRKMLKLR